MCLLSVVPNDHICWFEISVDVSLGVDTVKPIHQLQSNDYYSLNLEFAFFERFFKLFEVHTEELHD